MSENKKEKITPNSSLYYNEIPIEEFEGDKADFSKKIKSWTKKNKKEKKDGK